MREDFQNLFYMSIITLIRKSFKDFTGKENYKKNMLHGPSCKSSQQNIRKLNSPIYKKDNTMYPSEV